MARKSNKSTPTIIGQWLYRDGEAIRVESAEWFAWLETGHSFYHDENRFTVRCERRRNGFYWYAFKKVAGKLCKRYLGSSDKLTGAALQEAFSQN